jgi:hypothetical protein
MAQIDPFERLVELARQEPPPSWEATAETMRRVRAAGRPRPAAFLLGWRRSAAILAASAAAAVLAATLAGRDARTSTPKEPAQAVDTASASASAGEVVPTLDILGGLESEVNQLMGGAQPSRSTVVKT